MEAHRNGEIVSRQEPDWRELHVRDRFTGFRGIITARAEYCCDGSVTYRVECPGRPHEKPVQLWLDSTRLVIDEPLKMQQQPGGSIELQAPPPPPENQNTT